MNDLNLERILTRVSGPWSLEPEGAGIGLYDGTRGWIFDEAGRLVYFEDCSAGNTWSAKAHKLSV
jgi:hypothetical protein